MNFFKPIPVILLLLNMPVFANEPVKILEMPDCTTYVLTDTIKDIDKKENQIFFQSKVVYKEGHEEVIEDKKAAYELWDTTANCKTNEFNLKTIHFYDKEHKLLDSADTNELPYVTFKGIAKPGSKIFQAIKAACQNKQVLK